MNRKLLICTISLLTACSPDQHDHPELSTGKQLFDYHCADCHNASGQGKFLRGVPPNKGTALSQGQISHKIRKGTEGSRMPAFEGMSAVEAQKISKYLKQIE